jgi:hypothetical protein
MPEHFQPKIFVATKLARARGVRTEDFFSIASGAWRTGREALFFSRALGRSSVGPPHARPLSHCDVKQRGEGRKTKTTGGWTFSDPPGGRTDFFGVHPKKVGGQRSTARDWENRKGGSGKRLRFPTVTARLQRLVLFWGAPQKSPPFLAPQKSQKSPSPRARRGRLGTASAPKKSFPVKIGIHSIFGSYTPWICCRPCAVR